MDGKQLKNSILQWAIQGKLVPQDPNDEPASTLLEKIRAEKALLVSNGKLKKDKYESVIYKGDDNKYYEQIGKTVTCIDEDIPFEIPNSWEWVRIHNIVQINPKNESHDDTPSAFIPMEKIEATYGSKYTYDIVKWGNIRRNFTHFANGDVAFAKITPCFQNRKSAIFKDLPNSIGAGTTELKVLRPFGETINRWYLLYFLKSPYFIEEATFKGTANQQRIVAGYLENKLVPIPPLAEQQRIVARIEELMPLVERYAQAQASLDKLNGNIKDKLKKSILQEAIQGKLVPQDPNDEPASTLLHRINPSFTPPQYDEPLPQGWTPCKLKDIMDIVMGQSPKGESVNEQDGLEFHQGKICFTDKYIKPSNKFTTEALKIAEPNTLLLCVRAPVGDINITDRKLCIGRGLCAIHPKEGDLLFFLYLLRTLKSYFESKATGSTFGAISKEIILSTIVPIPPLAEQKRIVARIEELFAIVENINS